MKKALRYVRWLWVSGGLLFLLWLGLSFQAQGFDKAVVMMSNARVTVAQNDDTITFQPTHPVTDVHFLFLPGGMVEPLAYAPMARSLAEQGIATTIVAIPWRGAPIGFDEQAFFARLRMLLASDADTHWVLGGHSRGAALAAQFVHDYPDAVQGVVLLATTHPKDAGTDLSGVVLPVLKVSASNDEIAGADAIAANRVYLPEDTVYIQIEGGNHAQFGWYGTQFGDGRATISREVQQAEVLDALLHFFQRWHNN